MEIQHFGFIIFILIVNNSHPRRRKGERSSKKIGVRVRVKVPLKVFHVPRVPEVDLTGKEGQLKQYVALWKGKRISANLPYKVEFVVDIEGRCPIKFFAHLKEDEFDYLK
uniref:Ferredoxin thioredoxin reductase alpha chain domain-containing protein n=1 Tax=Manihot esculenta TaxID=3983 RepID=A0A2C9UMM7_MANES